MKYDTISASTAPATTSMKRIGFRFTKRMDFTGTRRMRLRDKTRL